MIARWWHWYRERQRLYREAEALIGHKLPDFMSTETLRETMRLEHEWRVLRIQLRGQRPDTTRRPS